MPISDAHLARVLAAYLRRTPAEAAQLTVPMRLLSDGGGFASRSAGGAIAATRAR
ncbi:hypothetical protein [Saccharomonospora azurea]|uniref:hypothetical protein n=1 Tax=Saccharomonospora azurea TaxID=40988 RepID=UPI003D8A41AE